MPAFQKPKSRNAATTLLMLGIIAVSMFMGMIVLAVETGVQVVDDPDTQLTGAPPGYQQRRWSHNWRRPCSGLLPGVLADRRGDSADPGVGR